MSLCKSFIDPAEARCCQQGVNYQALAGGGMHHMVLRLPCFELAARKGEEVKRCHKYEPQGEEHAVQIV